MKSPGALLADRLVEIGWTKMQLEERIGTGSGTVSRWCSGGRVPTFEMMCRIHEAIGFPTSNWRTPRSQRAA